MSAAIRSKLNHTETLNFSAGEFSKDESVDDKRTPAEAPHQLPPGRNTMRRLLASISFLGAAAVFAACSSSTSGDEGNHSGSVGSGAGGEENGIIFTAGGSSGQNGTGNSTSKGGASGKGSSSSSGAGGSGMGPAGQCDAPPDDSGCVGELYVGETIPLDIYVMFDQSGSMLHMEQGGVTRIDAVRDAVGQFLTDPASAGLGVGIGYFGYEPIGSTSCGPSDYEQADVAVGTLPDNAQAIIDSLAGRMPTGETPSGGAIRGACSYAKQWKTDHPGRETVILLVTDGNPEAPVTCGDKGAGPCCPTLDDAIAATTDCRNGMPGLKTYVLGVGPFLENLGKIATAGGSGMAYLVSGGDVSKQVLDALNRIRAAAQIPCELNIPTPPNGHTVDLTRVNVIRTSASCETTVLGYRDIPSSCDANGGWYFDDPSAPQKVVLCKKSCDDVSLPGEQLMFSVGCDRISIR
jgi:hypothetical protein